VVLGHVLPGAPPAAGGETVADMLDRPRIAGSRQGIARGRPRLLRELDQARVAGSVRLGNAHRLQPPRALGPRRSAHLDVPTTPARKRSVPVVVPRSLQPEERPGPRSACRASGQPTERPFEGQAIVL